MAAELYARVDHSQQATCEGGDLGNLDGLAPFQERHFKMMMHRDPFGVYVVEIHSHHGSHAPQETFLMRI